MFAWICFRLLEKLHQKQHFFGQPMCWKLYLIQALRGHTIQQLTSFLNLGQDPPPTNGVCATKRDLAVECFFSSRCIPSAFSKCKKLDFDGFDAHRWLQMYRCMFFSKTCRYHTTTPWNVHNISIRKPQHNTPRPPPLLSWRQHPLWHFDPLQRRGKRQLGSCAPSTSCSTPKASPHPQKNGTWVPCIPDTTVTVDVFFVAHLQFEQFSTRDFATFKKLTLS